MAWRWTTDSPYLAIFRTFGTESSTGTGDLNLGLKWQFHKESKASRLPALSASLYGRISHRRQHPTIGLRPHRIIG